MQALAHPDLPLVSVVTPVFNGAPYIAECIESVLAQTYFNWEYIILNNCSTDNTLEIVQAYANKIPRIHIYNNTRFVDVITNHNLALHLISKTSKYCKIVCADDWIFPDCISQMVDLCEKHPTVGIAAAYTISGDKIGNVGLPYPSSVVRGKEVCRLSLLGGPYVLGAPTSLLYRSEIVRSTQTFFPSLSPHADTAACYLYLQHYDFGFVHQILAFERLHPAQTSETSRSLNYYIAEHLHYLVEYGPVYLEPLELNSSINAHINVYYRFLGKNVFRKRGKAFWNYHLDQLQHCGCPLIKFKLVLTVIVQFLKALLNPWQTIETWLQRAH